MNDARRALPSVSSLLETAGVKALLGQNPRGVVLDAVRTAIEAARAGGDSTLSDVEWTDRITTNVNASNTRSLRRVINATGVIVHTNLGRAPLAPAAIAAITEVAAGFSNLEYDIETGARGSRYSHCVSLLRQLTGAEDALVVNNCAAALVLTLNALANKKEALVSRGELVEIGGSFRIPDIMTRSGARLIEVGTTNRTHDDDYRRAITPRTAAIVKVHRSNFAIEGFTSEVSVKNLAFIATEHGLPVVHDLGSGLLISLEAYGLSGEPTARDALSAGATVVTMSGDKLLGGPQAGIILGSGDVIARLRKNPFTRAMRVDKLTLAALEATLRLYLDPPRALSEIPVLAMLSASSADVRARAEAVVGLLERNNVKATVVETNASVGGGAFPTAKIPSFAVAIPGKAAQVEQRLRRAATPIVGRVLDGTLVLDMRTVAPADNVFLAESIARELS
ncbi:MAG TPA: L-seryl-tRNA(Sec) selenium transferase [Gemmatimonadaceae bacterium]